MVNELAAAIGLTIAGAAGGFISSWMSFNAKGEPFDGRKHGNALITGVLLGVAAGIAAVATDLTALDQAAYYVLAVTTFLGAAGVDRLRSSGSKMVHKNAAAAAETPAPAKEPP